MVSDIENLKEYLRGEIDYYSNNKKEERKDRQEIIELLKEISKSLNITTKTKELEKELFLYKVNYERAETKAEVWKEAYKLLLSQGKTKVWEREPRRKIDISNAIEGQNKAEEFLTNNNVKDIESQLAGGETVGAQNAVLSGLVAWLREKVVETIIEFLIRVIKENAVNVLDWLLGQTEDRIVDGYMRLTEEDREQIKGQLREHPRFAELLKKIEAREKQA